MKATLSQHEVINPFKFNGISHSYQLDQSISVLKIIGRYYSFYSNFKRPRCKDPDHMPGSAGSDLGLHCLPISHKKDARLI